MKLLLAHGADPSIATKDHTTPLMAFTGVGFTLGTVALIKQLMIERGIPIPDGN